VRRLSWHVVANCTNLCLCVRVVTLVHENVVVNFTFLDTRKRFKFWLLIIWWRIDWFTISFMWVNWIERHFRVTCVCRWREVWHCSRDWLVSVAAGNKAARLSRTRCRQSSATSYSCPRSWLTRVWQRFYIATLCSFIVISSSWFSEQRLELSATLCGCAIKKLLDFLTITEWSL